MGLVASTLLAAVTCVLCLRIVYLCVLHCNETGSTRINRASTRCIGKHRETKVNQNRSLDGFNSISIWTNNNNTRLDALCTTCIVVLVLFINFIYDRMVMSVNKDVSLFLWCISSSSPSSLNECVCVCVSNFHNWDDVFIVPFVAKVLVLLCKSKLGF